MSASPQLFVDFTSPGDSHAVVNGGWSFPEAHGTWNDGLEAQLRLECLEPDAAYECEIAMDCYRHPPQITAQRVTIFIAGDVIYSDVLDRATLVTFHISGQRAGRANECFLDFAFPDAVRPSSLGESDDRRLAFTIRSLALYRVPSDPATEGAMSEAGAVTVAYSQEGSHVRQEGHAHPMPSSASPRVAVITMVYNEEVYLPIWLKHYASQVGIENCYIIDHGSTDVSTEGLGRCNILRIPRSPYDPHLQSQFNSEFCSSLLRWYDWIVYSDVDELVMADPKIASNLVQYCKRDLPDVVTAIGLNVAHRLDVETEINLSKPITLQRSHVFTASSMCKPLLTRVPIVWSPGSHSSNAPLVFDHLYLFHLRWFDLPYGLRRLRKTRAMAWARTDAGQHQRVEDDQMLSMFVGFARLPPLDGVDLDPGSEPLKGFLDEVVASQDGREDGPYKVSLDIWAKNLWQLPPRFIGNF